MKRALIIMLCAVVLTLSTACTGADITPSTEATPMVSEAATPSPTEQPTPTPKPISEFVQSFSADPRAFILDAVCSQQTEMALLMTGLVANPTFDIASPDLIHYFNYQNYTEAYDEAEQFYISYDTTLYDISLQFADPSVDYSDDFNYKWLASDVGMMLNLEYTDETITVYNSDGTEETLVQKWAEGSEDSYSSSWLYVDSSYTDEGTALLSYSYPGQNDAFNALAADSFEMAALPFVSVLAPFEQTSSVGYSPNYLLDELGPSLGNVGMSWWNVTEDGIQQLTSILSSDPNASVIFENESYHSYSITIESDYFSGVTIEYYDYSGGEGAEPSYKVNCTIFF